MPLPLRIRAAGLTAAACLALGSLPAAALDAPSVITSGDSLSIGASVWVRPAAMDELAEWLRAAGGGTYRLTEDLFIPKGVSLTIERESSVPAVVELGGHGIFIEDGALLSLAGPMIFRGTAPVPMTGTPSMFTLGRDAALLTSQETRLEADGVCAVRLTGSSSSGFDAGFSRIVVRGENAVGIESDGNLYVSSLLIDALDGATGIRGGGSVHLFFSEVSSSGGAAIDAAGPVLLEGSWASPRDPSTRLMEVRIDPFPITPDFYMAGDPQIVLPEYWFIVARGDPQLGFPASMYWPILWEAADFSEPGVHTIQGRVENPLRVLAPSVPDWVQTSIVIVRSGEFYIKEILPAIDRQASLILFPPASAPEDTRLSASSDEGKSWTVWPVSKNGVFSLPPPGTYWLRAESEGKESANLFVLTVAEDGSIPSSSMLENGDRDDSHRDEPPVPEKEPSGEPSLGVSSEEPPEDEFTPHKDPETSSGIRREEAGVASEGAPLSCPAENPPEPSRESIRQEASSLHPAWEHPFSASPARAPRPEPSQETPAPPEDTPNRARSAASPAEPVPPGNRNGPALVAAVFAGCAAAAFTLYWIGIKRWRQKHWRKR